MKDELNRLREDVLGLFPRLEAKLGEDLSSNRREVLDRGRAALADSRYIVLTCGEFKRGKSSLLNELIGQRLFPVDVDITTATVCTLSWSETQGARVHLLPTGEEIQPPPKPIDLSEVPRYATEQGRVKDDPPVARIDIFAPIPQLESGLTLVDTPGIGSMNPAHTAATRGFLPEADALLFVASALQPLSTAELSFLSHAYEVCPIVLTAVSMIDKAVDEDEVITQTRARIADIMGMAPHDVDLVGVSALRHSTGIKTEDQVLITESGYPELERRLWTGLVDSCAIARLSRAVEVMEAVTSDSEAPLLNEKCGLASQEALKDIDEQLKAAQAQAHEARADVPRRSRLLAEEMEERSRPIRRELAQAIDEIHVYFHEATEDQAVLAEPSEMLNQLVQRIVDAQTLANDKLTAVIDEVAARFSEQLSIPLAGNGTEAARAELTLSAPQMDMPARRFATFRTVWGGATAGGAAGVIAGTLLALVFPPAALTIGATTLVYGTVIGGLAGQLIGVVSGRNHARLQKQESDAAERRRKLREYVLPRIDSAHRSSVDNLTQRLRDETKALTRAMEEQLAHTASSLELSRLRLQEVRARTSTENEARLRQVEHRLESYNTIYVTLAETRNRIDDLAEAGNVHDG